MRDIGLAEPPYREAFTVAVMNPVRVYVHGWSLRDDDSIRATIAHNADDNRQAVGGMIRLSSEGKPDPYDPFDAKRRRYAIATLVDGHAGLILVDGHKKRIAVFTDGQAMGHPTMKTIGLQDLVGAHP